MFLIIMTNVINLNTFFFRKYVFHKKRKIVKLHLIHKHHQEIVQKIEYIFFDYIIFRRKIQHICNNTRKNILYRRSHVVCMTH